MAETSLCSKCTALCCRYFALQIDTPKTAKQFDDIRWYLCHENVVVFIEDGDWYVGVLNKCKHLRDDNLCGIYETRPHICRGYTTDNCDYHGGDYNYEKLFTSADQLHEYALEKLKKLRARRRKRTGSPAPRWSRRELRIKRGANGRKKVSLPLLKE
jgi:uncharacterized protein